TLFRIAWNEIVNFDPNDLGGRHSRIESLAVDLIEITDVILLGTVLYIVALGLYQLFIDQSLALPRWLKVNNLTDLKRDLIGVVVVLLGVSFLGEVVKGEDKNLLLPFGAGIALVIAALGFILWLTPHKHDPDQVP
ncbi:MAG TPA: YqhA family protein, partial [Thermomicrobiales bacterium]|nr:YqhA family protein [Thermomicrobiales bacterium]